MTESDLSTADALCASIEKYWEENRHCYTYIDDEEAPECLREFIAHKSLSAIDQWQSRLDWHLLAEYKGIPVRVNVVSRMGDVGITRDLAQENGYSERVLVDDLTNFKRELNNVET